MLFGSKANVIKDNEFLRAGGNCNDTENINMDQRNTLGKSRNDCVHERFLVHKNSQPLKSPTRFGHIGCDAHENPTLKRARVGVVTEWVTF
ncbi:hypothetical protein HanPI659440_Chr03g0119951 [Helianthus annuus]|nr:hypothetical protein HanPI659440_Chr03g0119951 [Helianthus annuus]